ncbi:amino acid adenylation domain-containing protein [Pseudoduganella buxea]|nr:amino acid adenylation domain-containing protein [Pseudoduganella buxea]GGB95731.1 thioester reductase [Pseudoduganella buxea]
MNHTGDQMSRATTTAAGLHERFGLQAAATPGRIAVACGDVSLTYAELDRRATALAARVASQLAARPDDMTPRVGMFVQRSVDMIVAMLGILKAGAAYVPIDPRYPEQRIRFLLADAAVDLVVSRSADVQPVLAGQRLLLTDQPAAADDRWTPRPARPDDAAYVIYTSGSTGVPKGTVVEHGNVTRLFDVTAPQFGFSADDVWSVCHSVSFDFSVWEIWGALLHGGAALLVPGEVVESPARLAAFVAAHGVTILSQTPSAFGQFARAAAADALAFPALRTIVLGGERLEAGHLRCWFAHFGAALPQVINMYGITETTVHVTYRRMAASDLERPEHSPIGLPLADLQVHLLDEHGDAVGPGQQGEMVITGAGVARGYLGRPELTRERFPMLPLGPGGSTVPAYRSGDMARWHDGELMYLGRQDDQLKVRGFRIELREIEYQLEQCAGVTHCVAAVQDLGDGDKRLLAFVVIDADAALPAPALMVEAQRRLPPQMVPSRVIPVAAIPLTSNGKRNKEKLMNDMTTSDQQNQEAVRGQSQGTTQVVAEISAAMMGEQGLSWDIDLFDQGATSLSLSRIILELNARYALQLTGAELDGDCSIINIASTVNRAVKQNNSTMERAA